ncbi:MAG: polyphosphate kinase 2 family protein [Propionibacteriaceae bacterium]|jgi:PPK2 family polyphosphate:nucleotide phosphotransferase|nr:polyphosphate kinase 2 family protein [Propionibacteriaceae bacterium]
MGKKSHHATRPLSELLRVGPGPVRLADRDPAATPGFPGKGKDDADRFTGAAAVDLSDLQERLYANSKVDGPPAPSVLVVLQGMDTSGKGGVIRHAIGLVDPQGVQIKAFKVPTEEERAHHFLWRVRNALPRPGMIGIFDRSHYEDVLVGKVDQLAPPDEIAGRYGEINAFERELADSGTVVVKCMLHISADEQRRRLLERLDNPEKHWKYNPGDVDARLKWDAYQAAYEAALELCDAEPWHVVPSDHKWYRNWAVAELLREKLSAMGLDWPKGDFDAAVERARVEAS